MEKYVMQFLQGIMLILLAPGMAGLQQYFKALFKGRTRALIFIWQPYWDLLKWFKKPAIRPGSASHFFSVAPIIVFGAYACLAFSVPVYVTPLLNLDLITVFYILGLARFTLSLAGLDTGSVFGALGGSREMFLHLLTEVGLFLVLAALNIYWKTIDLVPIYKEHNTLRVFLDNPVLLLLGLAFGLLIMLEVGLIPIDNNETHLELTMNRKAIGLEYSGRYMALMDWAELINMIFLFGLFIQLFVPFFHSIYGVINFFGFIVRLAGLVLFTSLWEVSFPQMRLRKVAFMGWFSMLLSLITIIYIVAAGRSGT